MVLFTMDTSVGTDPKFMAVDTLGHLLAVRVTPANEQERAQVSQIAQDLQTVTQGQVKILYADQGDTGENPAQEAAEQK